VTLTIPNHDALETIHSLLSATMGSTLVARRAGRYDANVVTRANMTATVRNVVVSGAGHWCDDHSPDVS